MAIRKVLLPLISSGAGEAALSTAWTVAQLWNAHLTALHVQMDLEPAPALIAMFRGFIAKHGIKVTDATAGAESATASFLTLTGRETGCPPATGEACRSYRGAPSRHPRRGVLLECSTRRAV